jgi:hypothetical protein
MLNTRVHLSFIALQPGSIKNIITQNVKNKRDNVLLSYYGVGSMGHCMGRVRNKNLYKRLHVYQNLFIAIVVVPGVFVSLLTLGPCMYRKGLLQFTWCESRASIPV